jgi:2,4-dienoyl-CoA reductase (NADPH2)
VVLASGVTPRGLNIPGIQHPKVLSYIDVLRDQKAVGERVAIIGAGGIGFDVAEYLVVEGPSPTLNRDAWLHEWGVDLSMKTAGGVKDIPKHITPPARQIYLLQRKDEPLGKRLGKTSGWVHRITLRDKQVQMLQGVSYERVDDQGLHVTVDGKTRVLDVDNVVVCAGQEPLRELEDELVKNFVPVHRVGGADVAAELDAKRAIAQATWLAARV